MISGQSRKAGLQSTATGTKGILLWFVSEIIVNWKNDFIVLFFHPIKLTLAIGGI